MVGLSQMQWLMIDDEDPQPLSQNHVDLSQDEFYQGSTNQLFELPDIESPLRPTVRDAGISYPYSSPTDGYSDISYAFDSLREVLYCLVAVTEDVKSFASFDGVAWTVLSLPIFYVGTRLKIAYDVARDVVVLYGAWDTGTSDYTGTWEYTPSTDTWVDKNPAVRPPSWSIPIFYDGTYLLAVDMSGMWSWNGTVWANLGGTMDHYVYDGASIVKDLNTGNFVGLFWADVLPGVWVWTPGVGGVFVDLLDGPTAWYNGDFGLFWCPGINRVVLFYTQRETSTAYAVSAMWSLAIAGNTWDRLWYHEEDEGPLRFQQAAYFPTINKVVAINPFAGPE